jgi:hypothetical protein
VTYGKSDIIAPVMFKLAENDLKDRHVADGHERLGEYRRVRRQTLSFATGKNDCSHTENPFD